LDDDESRWQESFFAAVADAAKGVRWPEEAQLGPVPEENEPRGVARTQKRHVMLFMCLFGLTKTSRRRRRERVSEFLQVDLGLLEESRRLMNVRARDGPLWKVRGTHGMRILRSLTPSNQTAIEIMALGSRRFWGTPLRV
jgi:hypothetical protein